MKKIVCVIFLTSLIGLAFSQTPQGVFNEVNAQGRDFSTMSFKAEMEILSRGRTLTKAFFGYLQDEKNASFMEYTNAQDAGTRYLKIESDMWIYIPEAADVLKLSGHLLRDSMMGSDISYDDMADQGSLENDYLAESMQSTTFEGNEVYVLTIKAKDENAVSYIRQDLYIDKSTYNVLKTVMFAKGRNEDRAIKEFTMREYKTIGTLTLPMVLEVVDLRKKNSKTVVTYTEIEINTGIDDEVFTRAYLER